VSNRTCSRLFNVVLEFGQISVPGFEYARVTRGVNIALAAGAARLQAQLQVDLAIKAPARRFRSRQLD
jgi:hypothetical protein